MELSPEERRKIYEEEKARIEEEEGRQKPQDLDDERVSSTSLEPNAAGLLCYAGFWITGIIFLILEQKSRFVRFHAIQSIIVFGFLIIVTAVLSQIPMVGWFFGGVLGGLTFVLWIVLMVKAYQGDVFAIPLAGDIARKAAGITAGYEKGVVKDKPVVEHVEPPAPAAATVPPAAAPTPPAAAAPPVEVETRRRVRDRADDYARTGRAGRITSSSFAIAWSLAFLIFFHYFNKYVAYYRYDSPDWLRYTVLTDDFNAWLPIVTTTLILSIIGHIMLIAVDRYFLRETTLLILNLFGVATVVTLLIIFPFDFSVVPDSTITEVLPIIVTIVLIGIAIGLGIATLVSFIKLIVNAARGTVY